MKFLLALISIYLGLASCCRPPLQDVINESFIQREACNCYHEPSGFFSVQIPPHLINPSIQAGGEGNNRFVSFLDDQGQLIRIEAIQCQNEELCKILLEMHYKDFFRELFEEGVLIPILENFPGTEVLCEDEIFTEEFHEGYFVLLSIPGGATTIEAESGNRLDCLRGFLLSFSDNQLVVISNQYPPLIQLMLGELNLEKVHQYMLNELNEVRKSYENESPSFFSYVGD